MTVADAWPLQQAVYQAVTGAVASEGLQVLDHRPTNPPDEFVVLEGMNVDDTSHKDTERGRHSIVIGYFSRPISGATASLGQKRVHEVLAMIHAAVKDLRHGRGRMQFEFKNVDPGEDGATVSGMLRYTITL